MRGSSGKPSGDGGPPGLPAASTNGGAVPPVTGRGKEGNGAGSGRGDGLQASSTGGQSKGELRNGEMGGADSSSESGQGGSVGGAQDQEHLHGGNGGGSSSAAPHSSQFPSDGPNPAGLEQERYDGSKADGASGAGGRENAASSGNHSASSIHHSSHQSLQQQQQQQQYRGPWSADTRHGEGEQQATQHGRESGGPRSPSSSPTLPTDGKHLEGEQRGQNGGDNPPPPPSSPSSTSTHALHPSCSQSCAHHPISSNRSLRPPPWLSTRLRHGANSGMCSLLGTGSNSRGVNIMPLHHQRLTSCINRLRCTALPSLHPGGLRISHCCSSAASSPSCVRPLGRAQGHLMQNMESCIIHGVQINKKLASVDICKKQERKEKERKKENDYASQVPLRVLRKVP
eukprot:1159098-Pelagomonas_calceolata.AAC.17